MYKITYYRNMFCFQKIQKGKTCRYSRGASGYAINYHWDLVPFKIFWWKWDKLPTSTVDGRNPAPPVIHESLWNMGNYPYQLVQDSFHHQYHLNVHQPPSDPSVPCPPAGNSALCRSLAPRVSPVKTKGKLAHGDNLKYDTLHASCIM